MRTKKNRNQQASCYRRNPVCMNSNSNRVQFTSDLTPYPPVSSLQAIGLEPLPLCVTTRRMNLIFLVGHMALMGLNWFRFPVFRKQTVLFRCSLSATLGFCKTQPCWRCCCCRYFFFSFLLSLGGLWATLWKCNVSCSQLNGIGYCQCWCCCSETLSPIHIVYCILRSKSLGIMFSFELMSNVLVEARTKKRALAVSSIPYDTATARRSDQEWQRAMMQSMQSWRRNTNIVGFEFW